MEQKRISNVVIAGGGTAGWITAATLSNALGKGLNITLVESDEIPTVGVGEATIPPILLLHDILGIKESELLSELGGTFKLGIAFENWKSQGEQYIHSFGEAGLSNWVCRFVHYWLAGKRHGIDAEYGDYCLEHLAARNNKFSFSTGGKRNYAYHMDAGRYAMLLRKYSESLGVTRVEGKIQDVILDETSGDIAALSLASGERVEGDLFIDCTGFRALLIGQALKTEYTDWSHWLPCDRAVAVQTEVTSAPIPYTRAIAHKFGWQWKIPLQHRMGNGMVYCSRYQSDEEAIELLLSNIEGEPLIKPKSFQFTTGTRTSHWNKNCVAIGLSSGFLEPLESTSIHLIQRSAERLARMFPSDGIDEAKVDQFNQQTLLEITDIRDFLILHYHVNERTDSEFWNYCRHMPIPDSLAKRIDLFKRTGLIFRASHELFSDESWVQVLMGQGVVPSSYHPAADELSYDELQGFLQRALSRVSTAVSKMPTHDSFISYYCKAKR